MKKIRNFKCGWCMAQYEKMVTDDVKEIDCTQCNKKATRMIAVPRYFGNTTGRSPSVRF